MSFAPPVNTTIVRDNRIAEHIPVKKLTDFFEKRPWNRNPESIAARNSPIAKAMSGGAVYVLYRPTSGEVKIGYSEKNWINRWRDQGGSGAYSPAMVIFTDNPHGLERQIHRLFERWGIPKYSEHFQAEAVIRRLRALIGKPGLVAPKRKPIVKPRLKIEDHEKKIKTRVINTLSTYGPKTYMELRRPYSNRDRIIIQEKLVGSLEYGTDTVVKIGGRFHAVIDGVVIDTPATFKKLGGKNRKSDEK